MYCNPSAIISSILLLLTTIFFAHIFRTKRNKNKFNYL